MEYIERVKVEYLIMLLKEFKKETLITKQMVESVFDSAFNRQECDELINWDSINNCSTN